MQTHILQHNEIDPKTWNAFVHASPQGAPFVLCEYMDIIQPNWKALIVEEKGEWKAIMPIYIKQKWRFKAILQPFFAQHWGILFAPSSSIRTYDIYSQQKKYTQAILEIIDHIDLFSINFSPQFTYPIPFHWKNYELKTRYTYQLTLQPSTEDLYRNLATPLKRQIKKAQRNNLKMVSFDTISPLMKMVQLNADVGKNVWGTARESSGIFEQLAQYLFEHKMGRICGVVNPKGEVLAAALYLDFQQKSYYLLGAYHPQYSDSGAMSYLMWEAIVYSKSLDKALFDFEGSMILGIESFFRKFGAEAVSYLHIHRNQLPTLIKWIQELK